MNINIKSIIGILALLVGLCSATSRGECKNLCSNDIPQTLTRAQMCKSALQSSPASASMNYHHCLKGRSLSLRKTCLPTCEEEKITLTSFDACSKHYRRTEQISWCRRGYENTLDSMKLLLGMDNAVRDQESATTVHDESINIATSIEEESSVVEIQEVPMKNESVSLVLDDHWVESFSSTFDEEEKTILQASTTFTFNKTNDWTPMITNSSNTLVERSLMPLYMSDQYFTHTVPCLGDEMNLSFVKDDVGTSFDLSLDKPDSKEVLPAISHDTLDASSIVSSIILTSITTVFFMMIFIWLSAVHCWALLLGIISCLQSTTCLGRASSLTTRYIVDTSMYKQASVLMMMLILQYGVNTTTSLIRILLWPIESLLNIPRWVWRVYGPGSHGRSLLDIMLKSNQQGRKRCKVASTFNAIVQGLLDTGQASLLKIIRLSFAWARLVQVSVIVSCVLVLSIAVSISEDVGGCLYITRDAFVDMIRLIRVSIVKSYAIIHSAIVLPFIETTRDCLYHIQASIFGMARRTNVLVVISYTFVHSVAATVSTTIGCCLYFILAPVLGLARRAYVLVVISYTIVLLVIESISQAVRGCIHSIQTSIFGMARRIQVSAMHDLILILTRY